ncbi:XRE family transcriptional regulator [Corallococcus praedator]|uniref:XRE family transcriptional regulator n=3 Tax=Myxococcaceae TaxID=31 RepID=A0A3A8J7B9_9BACT|nr:XRE family transcriptional regulator [Corallococcus terminator]RKH15903.1 XRE family transcriptional regulator [Corallococcus sp. CA047B]RKH21661.1 XRE family transcriptional regulator [Corallococcus sp. CA031C]RKH93942.1 XRE family transcriptional regulator [Corallococcus praedator]
MRYAPSPRMDEQLGKKVGKAAREARARLGLTQAEVAATVGMNSMVYSRVERGKMVPSATMLCKLSMALRVSSDELLGLARTETEARREAQKEPPALRRLVTLARELEEEKLDALVAMARALSR